MTIDAPIVITGMPRSGTTFLHELLTYDPANRAPLCWETIHPYPERQGDDPELRRRRVDQELAAFSRLAPELQQMHALSASMPQECTEITAHNFQSMRFDTTHHVPSYRQWLDDAGHRDAYRFHRRFLQHLQYQRRTDGSSAPRWVLKCPDHVFALPSLMETYPDATLVFVHRDPERVLASVAPLTETLRRPFTRRIDTAAIGQQVRDRWALGAELMVDADSSGSLTTHRTLHLHYLSLIADPVAAVAAIYRAADAELSPTVARRIEDQARGAPGVPRAKADDRLAAYGLDGADLDERFAAYRAYFAIEQESGERMPARAPVPQRRGRPAATDSGSRQVLLDAPQPEPEL
jgi:hypothetical protein